MSALRPATALLGLFVATSGCQCGSEVTRPTEFELQASPGALDLGITAPGAAVTRTVELSHSAAFSVTLSADVSPVGFELLGERSFEIAAGATRTLEVVFLAPDPGVHSGELRLSPEGAAEVIVPLVAEVQACHGVRCDAPPGPCFEQQGACAEGACSYALRPAGSPCAEAGACTLSGVCDAEGACVQAPLSCDDPPPATCAGEGTRRAYEPSGQCLPPGGCSYVPLDEACPAPLFAASTCADGACSHQCLEGFTACERGCCSERLLSVGAYYGCVTTGAGGVRCWGANNAGQLGDGTTVSRNSAGLVSGISGGVLSLAAGSTHACAVLVAGTVKCWGSNYDGELGDGSYTYRTTPVNVSGLGTGVEKVVAGFAHTCALKSDGTVWCWGDNTSGELGDGSTVSKRPMAGPVVGLGEPVVDLASKRQSTFALTASGRVLAWGSPALSLQTGGTGWSSVPAEVIGLGADVAYLGRAAAAVQSGTLRMWGPNSQGQLGDGTTTARTGALDVAVPGPIQDAVQGYYHSCAIGAQGGLWCWGWNAYGQLGDGTTADHLSPELVPGLEADMVAVDVGVWHTCAMRQSGEVLCWGSNSSGALGNGTSDYFRYNPAPVVGL